RAFGVELIGLRYFNIYGPRQDSAGPYAAVIPRFFAACLRGEPPVIYGDGEQSRDFTFVSDAVRANLLAAGTASAACGRSYNVASGRRVSVNQLAGIVGEVSGRRLSPRHEPARPGDIRHSLACVERAQEALGFAPEVALPAGLGLTFADYETQEPRP
ncbi:MAG: NAD-dependent epimerase/dehydratase family protein, partial [Acidobacteriota bacterium]